MYESGWGKKLTYIFAASRFGIQDITQKHSKKYDEVLTRRDQVPETWLATTIEQFNEALSPAIKAEARERFSLDKKEVTDREATEEEKVGRESGSVAWRAERDELGTMSKAQLTVKQKVQLLFKQLVQGCGKDHCDNKQCKNNAAAMTPNEAAVEALKLVQAEQAIFCTTE